MRRALFGILLTLLLSANAALAQSRDATNSSTFATLYNFTDQVDGCCIYAGLARDRGGNLYGVAYLNIDAAHYGDIFKLSPSSQGYTLSVLESFTGNAGECMGTPALDSAGNLFGVCSNDNGSLWEYSHGKLTLLHTFSGAADGQAPVGELALDDSGNIYGTARDYGPKGGGTLWQYSLSTGTFKLLHSFSIYGDDGSGIGAGPRLDGTGTLWGSAQVGPNCYACGDGTIWNYDLNSGVFTVVSTLNNSVIRYPQARLAIDAAGTLYGTAYSQLPDNCGVVYELSKSNNYQPVIDYSFNEGLGCGPDGGLTFDAQGNLFGTTLSTGAGGNGSGTVYELKNVNGIWQKLLLHTFIGTDGTGPESALVTDGAGNWFGTTASGGTSNWGTVFEISGVK